MPEAIKKFALGWYPLDATFPGSCLTYSLIQKLEEEAEEEEAKEEEGEGEGEGEGEEEQVLSQERICPPLKLYFQ